MTVLMEAAMMGADIDGDVLVYLEMAQVRWSPCSYCSSIGVYILNTVFLQYHKIF